MPEYRAYILSDDDHIQSYETMACVDDESAIVAAKRLVTTWNSGRVHAR